MCSTLCLFTHQQSLAEYVHLKCYQTPSLVTFNVHHPTWLESLLRRWLWEDERAWSLSTCCICCSHIRPSAWGEMWRWGNSSTSTGRSSFSFTFTGEEETRTTTLLVWSHCIKITLLLLYSDNKFNIVCDTRNGIFLIFQVPLCRVVGGKWWYCWWQCYSYKEVSANITTRCIYSQIQLFTIIFQSSHIHFLCIFIAATLELTWPGWCGYIFFPEGVVQLMCSKYTKVGFHFKIQILCCASLIVVKNC